MTFILIVMFIVCMIIDVVLYVELKKTLKLNDNLQKFSTDVLSRWQTTLTSNKELISANQKLLKVVDTYKNLYRNTRNDFDRYQKLQEVVDADPGSS